MTFFLGHLLEQKGIEPWPKAGLGTLLASGPIGSPRAFEGTVILMFSYNSTLLTLSCNQRHFVDQFLFAQTSILPKIMCILNRSLLFLDCKKMLWVTFGAWRTVHTASRA